MFYNFYVHDGTWHGLVVNNFATNPDLRQTYPQACLDFVGGYPTFPSSQRNNV